MSGPCIQVTLLLFRLLLSVSFLLLLLFFDFSFVFVFLSLLLLVLFWSLLLSYVFFFFFFFFSEPAFSLPTIARFHCVQKPVNATHSSSCLVGGVTIRSLLLGCFKSQLCLERYWRGTKTTLMRLYGARTELNLTLHILSPPQWFSISMDSGVNHSIFSFFSFFPLINTVGGKLSWQTIIEFHWI